MARPRRELVDSGEAGFYHLLSRCVRGAFLCGNEPVTGHDLSHRRPWIRKRLRFLSRTFAIHVAGYAVMHNHLNVVVHTDPVRAGEWSREEVARRWLALHPRRDGYGRPIEVDEIEIARLAEDDALVERRRRQLADLSTFMRELNEWIARHANREDGAPGRFFEGRLKSHKLLDPAALLTCCAYVDLNPIRAGIAKTPEESVFTSVHERIRARQGEDAGAWLMPIEKPAGQDFPLHARCDGLFAMTRDHYLALVDWTGRAVREGNTGAIARDLAPILDRLEIEPEKWRREMTGIKRRVGTAVGRAAHLAAEAGRRGTRRVVSALKVPIRAEPDTI